jgi:tRNA dimethylallyltransferase
VGPTASGKTDLTLALARYLPVEILVADSRQVYRGMDIGTAKPSAAARAVIPHHLLDLAAPDERITVADWVQHARAAIAEVAHRGRTPMLVGGTGLYVSALVEGHRYTGQPELARRERLLARLDDEGLGALVEALERTAPEVAVAIDRTNPRRVIRALERAEAGDPTPSASPYPGEVVLVGLRRPRGVLNERIDARARSLFASGLLDEVRRLLAAGFRAELAPMTGHGYGEAMRHLAGEWTLDEAIEVTARRTRQYAKRQMTWFRNRLSVTWLDVGDAPGDDPSVVTQALEVLRRGSEPNRLP